jgi:ATP-dependent DNA helicase RecQ
MARTKFDHLLQTLTRYGYLRQEERTFEKDGKRIPYKMVFEGSNREGIERLRGKTITEIQGATVAKKPRSQPRGVRKPIRNVRNADTDVANSNMFAALKEWRLGEARRSKMPAFRILGDNSLHEIAERLPRSEGQLLEVCGIGPAKFKKYGKMILDLVESMVR